MAKNPEKLAAAEQVIDRVRSLIESGGLRSGDRLPAERELARELGVSTPAVSKHLAAMEARLGVPLVSRTTRRRIEEVALLLTLQQQLRGPH